MQVFPIVPVRIISTVHKDLKIPVVKYSDSKDDSKYFLENAGFLPFASGSTILKNLYCFRNLREKVEMYFTNS